MKINMYVAKDLLPEYLPCSVRCFRSSEDRLDCRIDAAAPLFDSLPQASGALRYLYVMEETFWREQSAVLPAGDYVIVHWEADSPIRSDCGLLGISGEVSVYSCFLALQQMILELNQWETTICEMVVREEDLIEAGRLSLKFLTNPICLYSASHQNIFSVERKKPREYCVLTEDVRWAFLAYEEVEDLRFNPDFAFSVQQTEPSIFPDEYWGYRILYDNIMKDGIFLARLMALEIDRPIRDTDYIILHRLMSMIRVSVERMVWTVNSHPRYVDDCIKQLTEGQVIPDSRLGAVFDQIGFAVNDEYVCFHVPITKDDTGSIVSIWGQLESSIRGCLTVVLEDSLVILIDLTRYGLDREQAVAAVICTLRDAVLHAGISMFFEGLGKLPAYHRQAVLALTYGEKKTPTYWYYRYENIEYYHLLDNLTGTFPVDALYPIGLRRLLEYDREHNREYTRALKVYLEENLSVTETIRRLYIQKSTFIYQLKRIREISDINLEHKETRLLYLMIFQVMEQRGLI